VRTIAGIAVGARAASRGLVPVDVTRGSYVLA